MAQTLADLLVSLSLDSAKLSAGLKKSAEEVTGFAAITAEASKRIEHLLEFEVVLHGAEQLFEFVKSGAEAADKLGKLSESVGLPVEQLSRLSYAAKMADVDQQGLAKSLEKLAKNMQSAGLDTGGSAKAFAALGIQVKDSEGNLRSTEDVFLDVADKFARMENGAGKTALAMALFGKSGADLIPLLNKGSEGIEEFGGAAQRAGKVLTEDLVRGADKFVETLKGLQGGAQVVGAQVAANIAPAFEGLVQSFTEGANGAENMRVASSALSSTIRTLAGMALVAQDGFASLAIRFVGIKNLVASVPSGLSAMRNELYKTYTELNDQAALYEKRMAILGFGEKAPVGMGDVRASERQTAPKVKAPVIADQKELDAQANALKHVIDLATEWQEKVASFGMDELGRLSVSLDEGKLAKLFEKAGPAAAQYRDQILAAARAHADLTRELEATKKGESAMDELARYAENLEKQLGKVNDASTEEQVRQSLTTGALRQHIDAMSKAGMDADTLVEKILGLAAAIDKKKAADIAAAEAQRRHDEAVSEAKNILTSHAGPLEHYRQQVAKINDAHELGALDAQQYGLALQYAYKDFVKAGGGGFAAAYISQLGLMTEATASFAHQAGAEFGKVTSSLVDGFAEATAHSIVFGDNLEQALGNVARNAISMLIADLIKIGLQMVLNAAIGTSLGAAATAASAAMAATTAAAWAPAAALASLATVGANAIPAEAALIGTVALAKTVAVVGEGVSLESGGYTGDGGRHDVAGVVHGQEFVINAPATSRYRPMLEAMNRGAGAVATGMQVTINNNAPGVDHEVRQIGPNEVEIIARKVLAQHGPSMVASEVADPSSRSSRALSQHTSAGRRRS